jgi:hypothetical protein
MKYINFSNVEELIFRNEELKNLFSSQFFHYFEQWKLSVRIPMLRQIGKQAVLDLLNSLKDEHVEILEDYFGERVMVETLNYKIVENIKIPLHEIEICDQLCNIIGSYYFTTWRDENYLYISLWR